MLILAILLQTTTCTTYGNQTTCVDNPLMKQPPVTLPAPAQVDNQAIANFGAAMRARKARKRAKAVGKMIAEGDCVGAMNYALERGDLELADYARSYCRNSPK